MHIETCVVASAWSLDAIFFFCSFSHTSYSGILATCFKMHYCPLQVSKGHCRISLTPKYHSLFLLSVIKTLQFKSTSSQVSTSSQHILMHTFSRSYTETSLWSMLMTVFLSLPRKLLFCKLFLFVLSVCFVFVILEPVLLLDLMSASSFPQLNTPLCLKNKKKIYTTKPTAQSRGVVSPYLLKRISSQPPDNSLIWLCPGPLQKP